MTGKIKVYNQFTTRWCSMFVVAHALAVRLKKDYKDVVVSPWQIVRLTFLHGGFKGIFNKSRSVQDVVAALKHYGLWVKLDGERRKIFPGSLMPLEEKELHQYLGRFPLIGVTNRQHTVVVTGNDMLYEGHYQVIDSQGRKGYRSMRKRYFIKFYFIINYIFNE